MLEMAEKIIAWENQGLRHFVIRVFIVVAYALTKFSFLLPQTIKIKMPTAWSFMMWWTAFKTGGDEIFIERYCILKDPESYQPKVNISEDYSDYKLSYNDIHFFYENGYLGPFDLLSLDEAAVLEHDMRALIETPDSSSIYQFSRGDYEIEVDENKPDHNVTQTYADSIEFMNWRDRHLEQPQLLHLFQHPAVTERCAQLLGPDLMVWRSMFFSKKPGDPGTLWHQAAAYWTDNLIEPVVYPNNYNELFQITAFFSLSKASTENGCMRLIPGTHKQIFSYKVKPSQTLGERRFDLNFPIETSEVKTIEMEAGQFYLFSERLLHGSHPNCSTDQLRLSLNCRIVTPDTRIYSDRMLQHGHNFAFTKIKNLNLARWRGVMIRGNNRSQVNRTAIVN